MTRSITIKIPGAPVGKGRPRASIAGGKPRLRTPKATRAWESMAAKIIALHWQGGAMDCPVAVTIEAVFRRPMRAKAAATHAHTARVDIDNAAKIVLDALVKARVMTDDRRVVQLLVTKRWTSGREDPCVIIKVEEARDETA